MVELSATAWEYVRTDGLEAAHGKVHELLRQHETRQALLDKVQLLLALGKRQESLNLLTRLLQRERFFNDDAFKYLFVFTLCECGRLNDSHALAKQLLTRHPIDTQVVSLAAAILVALKQPDDAVILVENAIAAGANMVVKTNLAEALMRDGCPERAALIAVPAAQALAEDGRASGIAAWTLWKSGDIEAAKPFAARAVELDNEPFWFEVFLQVCLARNDIEEGTRALDRAPGNVRQRYQAVFTRRHQPQAG